MKKLLAFGQHRPDTEALSALLDARLDTVRAGALETHVAACDTCRTRLAELRAVRGALRAMPDAEAPRSFRLRAADVERTRPATARSGLARALPLVSAAAAAASVVMIGAGVYANGGGASSDHASRTAYNSQQARTEDKAAAPSVADGPATDGGTKQMVDTPVASGAELGGAEAPATAPGGSVPAPSGRDAPATDASPPAAATVAAYSADTSGGGNDNANLWWYGAGVAGVVSAGAAGAALYARRKRDGI